MIGRRGLLLGALVVLGCRNGPRATTFDASTALPAPAASVVPASSDARALEAPWIETIDLPDGGLAFVAPPSGARARRPIVLAVHGAVDDPGLMCSAFRLVTDVYPFVVCPAGAPVGAPGDGRKYVWRSEDHLASRAHQAVEAVRARYPEHVAMDAPILYAAFSQGANMAGRLLSSDAEHFPRAVLTEGGYRVFENANVARAFAKGGGERVLFTCSQGGCVGAFAASTRTLARAGVAARVEYSGPHGHSMPPAVRDSIRANLPWIVAGMAGWEGYARAPRLPGGP
jgi:predicted esterase